MEYTPAYLVDWLADNYPKSFETYYNCSVQEWWEAWDKTETLDTAEEVFLSVCVNLGIKLPDDIREYLHTYFSQNGYYRRLL